MAATRGDDGAAADLVRALARAHEPDRYLAALLAPRPLRAELVAIAAFAAEVSRVPGIVRDHLVGEIRLQWWRDALHALHRGERTANPVADALGAAMRRRALAPAALEPVIEARSLQLHPDAQAGAHGASMAAQAESSLFEAALRILDLPVTAMAATACTDAGTAYGLARSLGLAATPALRGGARDALAGARQRIAQLDRRALVAFLPLAMVEPYLQAQERGNADPLDHSVRIAPVRRVWRIWRAKRRGHL